MGKRWSVCKGNKADTQRSEPRPKVLMTFEFQASIIPGHRCVPVKGVLESFCSLLTFFSLI